MSSSPQCADFKVYIIIIPHLGDSEGGGWRGRKGDRVNEPGHFANAFITPLWKPDFGS